MVRKLFGWFGCWRCCFLVDCGSGGGNDCYSGGFSGIRSELQGFSGSPVNSGANAAGIPVYTEFLNICDEILGGAIDDPSLSMNEKADIFNTIYLSTLYELKIGAGCLLILGERAAEKEMSSDIQAWDYDEQTIQAYKLEYDFIVNSPDNTILIK